jgi:hypothetical protein
LPFDHRESFETKLFGWEGALSAEHGKMKAGIVKKNAWLFV